MPQFFKQKEHTNSERTQEKFFNTDDLHARGEFATAVWLPTDPSP